jgi:uncharacterized membrane protein
MRNIFKKIHSDAVLTAAFLLLSVALTLLPSGFDDRVDRDAVRCRGTILEVDDSQIQQLGMIFTGDQGVVVRLENGPFKGRVLKATNPLLGQMDRDKIFRPGDSALMVLTVKDGKIVYVNPQEHYRIDLELILLGLFILALVSFGGWTGIKALVSFGFSAVCMWKVLIPLLLLGWPAIPVALGVVTLLTGAVIFLVAGLTRKGVTAFAGAMLGVFTSCILSVIFTRAFHVHGAIMPFAETLLYSGFGHLNLTDIYCAAVFLAASGAVMDLAMDVAASMDEVVAKKPDITRLEAVRSGLTVGRAVVGTMTTTLLFAYSGGYVTLLMAFMAQGIPLVNVANLIYVAAEVLKTLVGSFGLVMVAPFTALVGAVILVPSVHAGRGQD